MLTRRCRYCYFGTDCSWMPAHFVLKPFFLSCFKVRGPLTERMPKFTVHILIKLHPAEFD